jgi:hypothetical protein
MFSVFDGFRPKKDGFSRRQVFDDARGSAFECAACLDASVAKGFVSIDRVRPGKEMLARVVAMLTRLNRSLRYKQSHVLIPPSPNRSSFSARFPVVRAKLPPLASFPLPSILRASLQSAPIRNRPRRRGGLGQQALMVHRLPCCPGREKQ